MRNGLVRMCFSKGVVRGAALRHLEIYLCEDNNNSHTESGQYAVNSTLPARGPFYLPRRRSTASTYTTFTIWLIDLQLVKQESLFLELQSTPRSEPLLLR